MPVDKVTAPGGKSRDSLRVHFPERTIIATERAYPARMRLEIEVLKRLSAVGAPVPKYLGGTERVFFQEDVGSRRLSGVLANDVRLRRTATIESAVDSLMELRRAGEEANLADVVPALGAHPDWVGGLINSASVLSSRLGIASPRIDIAATVSRLSVPATRFVKWDARPGNASVDELGRVWWFDWEHCGKRQGMEDFAWLAGDEFCPFGPDVVVPVLERAPEPGVARQEIDYLGHFVTFHIVQRLAIIHNRFAKSGWIDPARAIRYDRIGADPELVGRLCGHGAGWANRASLTRPMVRWFNDCAAAMKGLTTA